MKTTSSKGTRYLTATYTVDASSTHELTYAAYTNKTRCNLCACARDIESHLRHTLSYIFCTIIS
jgi:hypothetical protein